jgi:hypothetical protein
VSSGDADARKGRCQNYAVFTRVYSFVFWIRDVVEQISGEIAGELEEKVPYPFAFRGPSETQLLVFGGLPREWENRVTSIDLLYASLTPNVLLTSLETAKGLISLNMSHVRLEGKGFQGPVILPLLNSFKLDLLRPELRIGRDRTFPETINEAYLKVGCKSEEYIESTRGITPKEYTNHDTVLHKYYVHEIRKVT